MKLSKAILHSAVLIGLAIAAAFAGQGATINERKENQQDRIANGVNSGQLTAGETANLETKESALNKEEHNMRAADNGKLTAGDRATLHHQQNKLSGRSTAKSTTDAYAVTACHRTSKSPCASCRGLFSWRNCRHRICEAVRLTVTLLQYILTRIARPGRIVSS